MGQASNSFSDGMVKDINPINVPATALTDCKNGTILTYNGNELCLQNDMGNFGLKNCKLSPGYVPVGLKEYGGILYIVSYNPATDRTEIGSYPSTKVNARLDDGTTLSETINYIDWTQTQTYTDLLDKYHIQVFTDKDPERWKINPGDQVKIEWEGNEVKEEREVLDENGKKQLDEDGNVIKETVITGIKQEPFQKTEFYIMDENRNLTNIDEYIQEHLAYKSSAMSKNDEVRWKIPGWLAVKLCFPDIDNFLINFTTGNSPNFKGDNIPAELNINLKFRTLMSDGLYKGPVEIKEVDSEGKETTKNIQAKVIYEVTLDQTYVVKKDKEGNELKDENGNLIFETDNNGNIIIGERTISGEDLFENTPVNMPNGQYYFNTEGKSYTFTVMKGCRITVTATPYIGNVAYDKFKKEYTYTADATSFDENNVEIGNNYFTYALSEDESELKVMFNTTGMANTVGARLEWGLSRLTGETNSTLNWTPIRNNIEQTTPDYHQVDTWETAEDITTSLTINLVKYDKSFDGSDDSGNKNIDGSGHNYKQIVPEDIYLLQFRIILDNKYFQNDNMKRLVIASKLMNGFNDAKYYEITFDRWFANYEKYVIGEENLNSPTYVIEKTINTQAPLWFRELKHNMQVAIYDKFITKDQFNQIINYNNNQKIYTEQYYTIKSDGILSNIIIPHGPMWRFLDVNANIEIGLEPNNKQFNKYTGKLEDVKKNISVTTSGMLSETVSLNWVSFGKDMFDYKYTPIGEPTDGIYPYDKSIIAFDTAPSETSPTKLHTLNIRTYIETVTVHREGNDERPYGYDPYVYLYKRFQEDEVLWPVELQIQAIKWNNDNQNRTWIHCFSDPSGSDFVSIGGDKRDEWYHAGSYCLMIRNRHTLNHCLYFFRNNSSSWADFSSLVNKLRKNIYCFEKTSQSLNGGFVTITQHNSSD